MINIIGIATDPGLGRIPQTNGCVGCDMAYADSDDFACPMCVQVMGEKAWEAKRVELLKLVA